MRTPYLYIRSIYFLQCFVALSKNYHQNLRAALNQPLTNQPTSHTTSYPSPRLLTITIASLQPLPASYSSPLKTQAGPFSFPIDHLGCCRLCVTGSVRLAWPEEESVAKPFRVASEHILDIPVVAQTGSFRLYAPSLNGSQPPQKSRY